MDIQNPLFDNAFSSSIWKNDSKINELKVSLANIEKTVTKYLSFISDDFPNLTDHSITHSKMLWNYANIISGEKTNRLNPLEAYVMHVVFLIHDAGMCYSILNNQTEIEDDPLYQDFIIRNGDSSEVREEALFYTVRERHGDFAVRIATEKLSEDEYLISDISLREELGLLIGKIAKSHTCNINFIEREFGPRYINPNFPTDWSINCQQLSFLLRTSDAAHIDNLRTPKTNRMIGKISGVSKDHWTFQKKLGFPELSNDGLLMYSTNAPFEPDEQKAWWFCYEALLVLDTELKNADEYIKVNNLEPFVARGVKAINDTLELGKNYIRTSGWNSINTQIKVSNPVHIASELGGIKLYGQANIALRELIQNSIDAVNLHRIYTGQNNINVGEIKISIERDSDEFYLILSDNGIGMSQTIMTNELLDFGGSYWKSSRFKYDFEGMQSRGFESIGKFGIGFFSIFMLGTVITVTSWKFGEAISSMKTLDFYDGLSSNPILRNANDAERSLIIDRGTSIKIKLYEDPYSEIGLIGSSRFSDNKLFSLVKHFVPFPNVKITVKELDGDISSVSPNLLETIEAEQFIDHIHTNRKDSDEIDSVVNALKTMNLKLFDINDDQRLLGRLAVLPQIGNYSISTTSVVLSNGIRINQLDGFVGYIVSDEIISIKRDSFSKLIPYQSLKDWAYNQKAFIEKSQLKHHYSHIYNDLLMTFSLFDESLPIALSKEKNNYYYVSIKQFKTFLENNSTLKIYQEGHSLSARSPDCDGFIKLGYRLNFKNIILEEDEDKLTEHHKLIESLIKEVWGDFKLNPNNLIGKGAYRFDLPFVSVEEYQKIDISQIF